LVAARARALPLAPDVPLMAPLPHALQSAPALPNPLHLAWGG